MSRNDEWAEETGQEREKAVDAHTSAEIPQSLGLSQLQNFLILLPGHVCVF